MKKMLVILATVLATGCASTSDLEVLSARVTDLEGSVKVAVADSAEAKEAAAQAAIKATAAEAAANKAASYAQNVSEKLDRLFKKSSYK